MLSEQSAPALPWHEPMWQRMIMALQQNRLPHAMLFWGQLGLGKRQFAKILARRLLCTGGADEACLSCSSCLLFQEDSHPDLITISPLSDKKQISIEQIRSLQATLSLSRSQLSAQVVLLPNAEQLNTASANGLLKILEEPSSNVYYLLVTEHLSAVPITIQSRCQKNYFASVSHQQSQQFLRDNGLDLQLAELLHGSPCRAFALLENEGIKQSTEIFNSLTALAAGQLNPCQASECWQQQDLTFCLQLLFVWFSDLLKIKQVGTLQYVTYQGQSKALLNQADIMQEAYLFTILGDILELSQHLATGHQLNIGLWLDNLAINILRGFNGKNG